MTGFSALHCYNTIQRRGGRGNLSLYTVLPYLVMATCCGFGRRNKEKRDKPSLHFHNFPLKKPDKLKPWLSKFNKHGFLGKSSAVLRPFELTIWCFKVPELSDISSITGVSSALSTYFCSYKKLATDAARHVTAVRDSHSLSGVGVHDVTHSRCHGGTKKLSVFCVIM